MGIKESNQADRKKYEIIRKQLKIVDRQEEKILNQVELAFIKNKINPIVENIEDIIPEKLKSTLNLAFYKGFQLVYEKGNAYIEKTYDKDKIQLEYDLNDYAVDRSKSINYVKRLDKKSNQSKLLNSSIAAVEGGVLGILGIGLPDIPLFLAVMIRNINEIALSYGFDYDSEEEKCYILSLICCALTKEDRQLELNKQVDSLAERISNNITTDIQLETQLKQTAEVLSDALLTAKFIQGIPLVGIIGGVVNHTIIRKIGKYASVKYKKRYLLRKLKEIN